MAVSDKIVGHAATKMSGNSVGCPCSEGVRRGLGAGKERSRVGGGPLAFRKSARVVMMRERGGCAGHGRGREPCLGKAGGAQATRRRWSWAWPRDMPRKRWPTPASPRGTVRRRGHEPRPAYRFAPRSFSQIWQIQGCRPLWPATCIARRARRHNGQIGGGPVCRASPAHSDDQARPSPVPSGSRFMLRLIRPRSRSTSSTVTSTSLPTVTTLDGSATYVSARWLT